MVSPVAYLSIDISVLSIFRRLKEVLLATLSPEKEKRALLCNSARFMAALGEESVSGLGVAVAGRSTFG